MRKALRDLLTYFLDHWSNETWSGYHQLASILVEFTIEAVRWTLSVVMDLAMRSFSPKHQHYSAPWTWFLLVRTELHWSHWMVRRFRLNSASHGSLLEIPGPVPSYLNSCIKQSIRPHRLTHTLIVLITINDKSFKLPLLFYSSSLSHPLFFTTLSIQCLLVVSICTKHFQVSAKKSLSYLT